MNALNYEMIQIFFEKLRSWHTTQQYPRVMILSGEGGLAFCAGGDIVSMYKAKQQGKDTKLLWSVLG